MAKSKKTKKTAAEPKIKVRDLKPEKDPKGGALYLKYDSPTLKIESPTVKLNPTLGTNQFLKDHK